jgi:hypothetical protein
MARRDITKRPRRGLSAEERQELFREFKLGIFALAALVLLVVTLCWGRGSSAGTAPGEGDADEQSTLMRVVWNPEAGRGGRPPAPTRRVIPPGGQRNPRRREGNDRRERPRRVEPQRPAPVERRPRPTYRNYVVKRRDTLWKIAENELGSGKLWKLIRKANPSLRSPKKLRRGMILRIPVTSSKGLPSGRLAGGGQSGGSGMYLDSSKS